MSVKSKYVFLLIGLVLSILSISCATHQARQFDRAVTDASVVEEKDVYYDLISIQKENENLVWNQDKTKLKVVMWKSLESFNTYYKNHTKTSLTQENVTWVTTAPQVQRFGSDYLKKNPSASKEEIDLRLKQYLGLKPGWTYDVFVELWVDIKDLFRPCVDPEINDSKCNIKFSEAVLTEKLVIKNINCYPCFYKNLYFKDFRKRPGIPWSGLGYTYDWGNLTHPFGASEFILVPNAAYEIVNVFKTMEYIK